MIHITRSLAVRGALALLLSSGFLVLEGCTTISKQAKSSLEAGDYEKAAALYERVVQRDPGDKEAIEGLKRARAGVIETRLIQVRKSRQAKLDDQALDALLEVIEIEKKWKMGPPANSAFTQEEEMGYAANTAAAKAELALKERHPLLVVAKLERYAPVFQGKGEARFKSYMARARELGKQHCGELRKLNLRQRPYFGEFVLRYCGHWGADTSDLAGRIGSKTADLLRAVELDAKIEGLPARLSTFARETFEGALKRTAWYDAHGKQSLNIALAGKYEYDLQKVQVSLVHQYQESEQYVDNEIVTKYRQVPHTEMETSFDPVSKAMVTRPVTKYRQESYTESQPVTRTRTVTKTYPYGAWKHIQKMRLEIQGDVAVADRKLAAQVHDEATGSDDEHDLNMPAIGLKPKKARLPAQDDWIKTHLVKMATETERKLADLWTEMYCSPSTEAGGIEVNGEQVMRCGRMLRGPAPGFVEEWHVQNFGLGAVEVARRIAK